MALKPYAAYAAYGDQEASKKHKKKLPWILGAFAAIGGFFGAVATESSDDGIATGIVVGAGIGFLIYLAVLHFSSAATADSLYATDWCKEYQLTYLPSAAAPSNAPYANSGVRQDTGFGIEGTYNGVQLYFYNFSYYTRQSNGKTTTEVEHAFRILRLTGRELPVERLTIHQRGFMNTFEFVDKLQAAVTPERPISLESTDFNEKYDLTIDDKADEIWIRRIFDPATIAAAVSGEIEIPDLRYYDKAWWLVESGHYGVKDLNNVLHWQIRAAGAIAHLSRIQNL